MPEPTPSVHTGAGEPVLLIHPFMLSHEVWSDVVPTLARDHEVVAATLPGHWGGPRLPWREVGLDAFVDGVEALLDDLGWETCHVAGNSIGGWVALELARRGRARSVTAIAPAGGWRRFSVTQQLVGLKFLALAPLALLGRLLGDLARRPRWLVRLGLRVVSVDPDRVPQHQRDAFVRAATHCSAFLPYLWSDLRRGGLLDLTEVDAPVRLVICEDDWLLPPARHVAPFTDQLPDVDVVRLRGVGHVPMYDDPGRIAELIAEQVREAAIRAGGDRDQRAG
ncbi:alpha/beta fold hydrolase [Nocardioides sp. SYSU D00038]|uniref:alpha/beta fold hydrolase n=1 Tax=Nocardioides sp. SYSU D00038 TaxID=2812554 RepID=UPI00196752C1|nr:alpha/beta fold hydrolase [Nocardioides sp. SYSU D00038]